MHLVEYAQLIGVIGLLVAVIGTLIGGPYCALRKRSVEIGVLALVVVLFVSFFIWVLIENYGIGPHNPMTPILLLVALPTGCIMIGILLSFLAQFLRRRTLEE